MYFKWNKDTVNLFNLSEIFFFKISDQYEITPNRRQTNTTELDNPRTWLALSVLELTISKENHGKSLRCVAVHESYSTKSSSIEVRLDVMCKYYV